MKNSDRVWFAGMLFFIWSGHQDYKLYELILQSVGFICMIATLILGVRGK